jgi:hypothetical protein
VAYVDERLNFGDETNLGARVEVLVLLVDAVDEGTLVVRAAPPLLLLRSDQHGAPLVELHLLLSPLRLLLSPLRLLHRPLSPTFLFGARARR